MGKNRNMGEKGILRFRYSGFLIKTIIFLFFFVNTPVGNCGVLKTDKIFFDFQNTTLKRSFQQISEKTGCKIEISENLFDVDVTVKFQFHDIDQALKRTLKCAGVENYIIIESKDGKLYEINAVTDNPKPKKREKEHFSQILESPIYNSHGENEPDPFAVIMVEPTEDKPRGLTLAELKMGIQEYSGKKPDPSNVIMVEPTEAVPSGLTLAELEAGIIEEIEAKLDPDTVIVVASTEDKPGGITLKEIETGIKDSELEEIPDFEVIINSSL